MDASGKRNRATAGLWLALSLVSLPATAQTPNPLPEWYYTEGHLLEHYIKGDLPKWERTAGLSAEVQPKFSGANAYAIGEGPSLDFRYRDIAFASTGEGVGVNLLSSKRYRGGIAVTYDLGRPGRVDHPVGELGNISPSPEAKIFFEYMFVFPAVVRVDARHSFGGQGGWIGDLSLYSPLAGSEQYFIFAGPAVTFANDDNMRHNFGVSAAQSRASGYPQYNASGGLQSGSFAVTGGYFFTKHWLAESALAAQKLFGPAANSSFVQERVQLAGTFSLNYRW